MEDKPLYGIYSTVSRKYVFGIQEESKTKAKKALFRAIGTDAYKWRFEVRKLPKSGLPDYKKPDHKQEPEPLPNWKEKMKKKKDDGEKIKQYADYIIKVLKHYGVVIQRYDSYSSNSIYLKFDYGVCNSLRISDHEGYKHLPYRYNLQTDLKASYTTSTKKGWPRYFAYPPHIKYLVLKILRDRQARINQYGMEAYKGFMEGNRKENENEQGFWEKAYLV